MIDALLSPPSAGGDEGRIVLLDGGLATELERRGADLRDPLWSAKTLLTDADLIRQVHLDYFRAGARIVTGASYQASFEGFATRGLDRVQSEDLMRLSVRLVQEARARFLGEGGEGPVLVAASVGCYGASLHDGSEYRGDYGLSARQLMDWHRPRLEALISAGPDVLACETIPCQLEVEALVRLLEEFPGVPAWISCSCRHGAALCHGEKFSQAVAVVNDAPSVFAVGVNCTPPWFVEPLLHEAAAVAHKPLLAYPNSGASWDAQSKTWSEGAAPFAWAEAARRWRKAGARFIGGCCRTTPQTIREISRAFGF